MNKIKLLLAEDDVNLGSLLKDYLELKAYDVALVGDGVRALEVFNQEKFSLCILDIMMPRMDGFTLAKKIREVSTVPIIFLSAKSLCDDKINGFKIGCDDYLTKPFNSEELLLRIQAVLKRAGDRINNSDSEEYCIGRYKFDYDGRLLKFNDDVIKLTTKENELLKLLIMNSNVILDRNVALKSIWKNDTYFSSRSMDVYITRLRSYLKKDENIEIINIHGQGYKLINP